jgi:hypothetical protein
MAVNARTFQILYIIRQRALNDLGTTMDNIGEFLANRRKDAPDIYHRAYIAPSALVPLLDRMTTGEGLLNVDPTTREYTLTPMASQMADLLDGTDACAASFIDFYKEALCLAVLKQRQRLGQPPANPREVAAIANISLDSARRGLSTLAEHDKIVEDRDQRTPTYAMPEPIVLNKGVDPEAATCIPQGRQDDSLADLLAGIDEDDNEWATSGPTSPAAAANIEPEDLLSLGKILGDDEDVPADFSRPTTGSQPSPFDFFPPRVEVIRRLVEDDEDDNVAADPYDWNSVPPATKEAFTTQAKAAGMSLGEFIRKLVQFHEEQIREALFGYRKKF